MLSAQLDLFGETFTEPEPVIRFLDHYSADTLVSRAIRLEYITSAHSGFSFMFSVSMGYLLNEARSTYVNGEYAATILIAQSFIEHWLMPRAYDSAGPRATRWGLAAMVRHFRETGRIPEFLLDQIDRLRALRNPFVHASPRGEHAIEWRSLRNDRPIDYVMHRDARNALGLMYAVVVYVP